MLPHYDSHSDGYREFSLMFNGNSVDNGDHEDHNQYLEGCDRYDRDNASSRMPGSLPIEAQYTSQYDGEELDSF
jgi:hypothetical protein